MFSLMNATDEILETTKGLFGWVYKPQPGSSRPRNSCLVGCISHVARLHLCNLRPVAWLRLCYRIQRTSRARLRLTRVRPPLRLPHLPFLPSPHTFCSASRSTTPHAGERARALIEPCLCWWVSPTCGHGSSAGARPVELHISRVEGARPRAAG